MLSSEVPYLSTDSPQLETPSDFVLELFPHQKRALHRMVSIERDEAFLKQGFQGKNLGTFLSYKARGGCLCDGVGMGKTASTLALICAEPRDKRLGPNLLLAPTHLLQQWSNEVKKFCPNGVRVITGLQGFQDVARNDPKSLDNRTLVVVDAHSVIQSKQWYYEFRKVYNRAGGEVQLEPGQLKRYMEKLLSISPGFKGTFYGHGGPKEQALWFPQTLLNGRVFRRVIFDEVQDLIREGSEEKDCLLQLVAGGHAKNVWLVTATPFPSGPDSVYANHQLLGFQRLRLYCDYDPHAPGMENQPFEIIKRKLYIRSPEETRKHEALRMETEVIVKKFKQSPMEGILYDGIAQLVAALDMENESEASLWSTRRLPIREAADHIACSLTIRELLAEKRYPHGRPPVITVPTARKLAFQNGGFRTLAGKVKTGWKQQLQETRRRITEVEEDLLPALSKSVLLARFIREKMDAEGMGEKGKLRGYEETIKVFIDENDITSLRISDGKGSAEKIVRKGPHIADFATNKLTDAKTLSTFLGRSTRMYTNRKQALIGLKKSAEVLEDTLKKLDAPKVATDPVPYFGSKVEAFLNYFKEKVGENEKVVLFTYMDSMVSILQEVCTRRDIPALILKGFDAQKKGETIRMFVHEPVHRILIMSMGTSSSGTNLQVANHVVIFDLPSDSAAASAANVHQCIGRVVRMGQEKKVSIAYMISEGTVEETLFDEMMDEAAKLEKTDKDSKYTCELRALDVSKLPPVQPSSSSSSSSNQNDLNEAEEEEVQEMKTLTLEERLQLKMAQAEILQIEEDDGDEDDDNVDIKNNDEKTYKEKTEQQPNSSSSNNSNSSNNKRPVSILLDLSENSNDAHIVTSRAVNTTTPTTVSKRVKLEK